MKISKLLLVISSTLFFSVANAEEFTIATVNLTHPDHGRAPEYIKMSGCVQADDIKIIAGKDKVEVERALINFQSGKDKNVIFMSTLEPNEETRWRGLGFHSKSSCIDSLLIQGYSKHAQTAVIEIKGKKAKADS